MSIRVPSASVPVMAAAVSQHRRPTYVYEEVDDEEPPPRSGPHSRYSRSRRGVSPRSGRHYHTNPESRPSPRTSVSESEYETDVTMDSEDERAMYPPPPHGKAVDMVPVSRSAMHERLNRNRDAIHEDEEHAPRDSRHAPSSGRRRSPSRQPSRHPSHRSSKKDQYRRPREEFPEEDVVVDDERPHYAPRPSRTYYEPEGFPPSRPSMPLKRANTVGGSHFPSSQSYVSRRSGYDNAFGFPMQPPAPERAARPAAACVVCMEDHIPPHEMVKLDCNHSMCSRCMRRNFKLSLSDPQHMPPRCCTADHIPLKHVEDLFDPEFKRKWNRKFAEHSTRNRVYCPARNCGEWIRPEDFRSNDQAKCGRCKTKLCTSCHGRWHYPRACPRDVETAQFLEDARRNGWQRCHRCHAVVELKEGCNHMTCRCGGEFCMVCGSKWKTCDCPFFSDAADSDEPDDYMDVAMDALNPFAGARFDGPAKRFTAGPSSPRDFRSDTGPPPLASSVRPRPSSYEEEMMINHLQYRRETQHPPRKSRQFPEERDDRARPRPRRWTENEQHAPPYHQGRPVPDEYRRRPATVIVPPPAQMHRPVVPPPRSAYEAPSPGLDYVAGASRHRGMRYASPERYHAPSEPLSPERDWYPSRPESPNEMAWGGRSRPQSPERGRWRAPSRAPSVTGKELLRRARSRARSIYASPERERSHSVETRRNPSRFPSRAASRAPSRAASRAPSRVPSRAPSPPETRRAPSPPASRRAPSRARSRRAPSPSYRAPSPPGTHRSPSPDRRRTRTPGRSKSRARTPDRRRAQTPDQRRATSMERRLADRFNADVRQNSPAMVGALAPIGPMGPPGPMMMMPPPPPPPSHAPTSYTMGPPMPMAPVPPPAATPTLRRHMMEDEVYSIPAANRGMPMPMFHEQESALNEGSPHAPNVRRRPPKATRVHGHDLPRPSVLAGLAGPGRGLNRVFEWRNYVEPGLPDEQPIAA